MNRVKFSLIGHRHLSICNPIHSDKVDRAIELLQLRPGDRVVDYGAGKGEILIRALARYNAIGTGIELHEALISEMQRNASLRITREQLNLVMKDAKQFIAEDLQNPFDAGFCVGSIHAFGGYMDALRALQASVKVGGVILIGHGYWKRSPYPEFLDFLKSDAEMLGNHASNVLAAESIGLTPLWACVASEDDWDEYEWQYSLAIENYLAENPKDADADAMRERIENWRTATLKWGRDCFGFGLYLFKRKL